MTDPISVRRCLCRAVQAASPDVSAVAQYLLQAPCKRFRPLLLLLVNRMLQLSAQRKHKTQSFISRSINGTRGEKGIGSE